MSNKLWAIYQSEPYEPIYEEFLVNDEATAKWWCEEMNKTTELRNCYGCREYVHPPIVQKSSLVLNFNFRFGFHDLNLVDSSAHHFSHEELGVVNAWYGLEDQWIQVNSSSTISYEDGLNKALIKARTIKENLKK